MKVVKQAIDIQIFSYSEYPTAVVVVVVVGAYQAVYAWIYDDLWCIWSFILAAVRLYDF